MYDNKLILSQLPRTEDNRIASLILQGRPGIGKTHFAQALVPNGPLVRIPMATRTNEDFGAYPLPVREEMEVDKRDDMGNLVLENGKPIRVMKKINRVEQALSEASVEPLLDRVIGDDYGVLLLDDVTLSDPRLQSAILEIVQFGKIAGETLGKNVIVVLTGNTTADGAYAVEWSKPLLGRCLLVNLEPDMDVWLDLDDNQDIDPVVVGFLKDHPEFFAPKVDDEKTTDESGKTPSPRDWTRLGKAFGQQGGYKKFKPSLIWETPMAYANSFCGTKAGSAFANYARNFGVYPTGEELYNDAKSWESVPEDKKDMLSGAIAVVFALRNYSISLIEKSLTNQKECFEIIKTMLDRTRLIAKNNQEVVAYMTKYFLQWATQEEAKSERKNAMLATCEVLTSKEYSEDEDFKDFLDTLYRINNSK